MLRKAAPAAQLAAAVRTAWQTKQNTRSQGCLTGQSETLRGCGGSYTANIWVGSPECMLQIRHLGGCRGTLEHPWWCCCWGTFLARPPHVLPPRWVVQWPQRCPNSGTRQGRLHRHGLELVPFPLTAVTPGQQGVAWQVCGAGPSTVALPGTASPSPLTPFHCLCSSPACPALWP